jgi:hypothetical protein
MSRHPGPGETTKGAFGPYLAWIAVVAVYAWPFGVFHGAVRWIVGSIWLALSLAVTAVILVGKHSAGRKPRSTGGSQDPEAEFRAEHVPGSREYKARHGLR